MNRAHTLQEVVDAGWAPSVHYLTVRLRRGEIKGRKVGRHWFMSDSDIDWYIDYCANRVAAANVAEAPIRFGLSLASQRRRA